MKKGVIDELILAARDELGAAKAEKCSCSGATFRARACPHDKKIHDAENILADVMWIKVDRDNGT